MNKALSLLLEMRDLLESNNIPYFLDCGALINLYVEGKLKDDENDVDLTLNMTEYETLKTLLNEKFKNNEFDKINIRSKEITVIRGGIKCDFIFFDFKGDILRLYSYKQNPFNGNKWNWEWIALYPKNVYYPAKKHTFSNGETFWVHNDVEKKLEIHYGKDWRIPKPHIKGFTADMATNIDKDYVPIAVVMTTIARDEILLKCLPSYLQYPIKLYLLDQGKETEEKNKLYEELRAKGHFIEYWKGKEVGLSGARNYLLQHVDQEYVFITEDDIELLTNPYSLLSYFWNNNLGVLGGMLIKQPSGVTQHYEYELLLKDGVLEYKKSNKIDLVLNFFLAKTAVFKDLQYDPELLLAEHTGWFLKLKELNKWKVEYCTKLIGNHHHARPENYMKLRKRAADIFAPIMRKKFGITKVIKDGKIEWEQK